jgi:hypothetical protein
MLSNNFGYLENYVADISRGDKDVACVPIELSGPVLQGNDQIAGR